MREWRAANALTLADAVAFLQLTSGEQVLEMEAGTRPVMDGPWDAGTETLDAGAETPGGV